MEKQQACNCGLCAYAQKENGKIWCPFHDEAVSEKLVCDDFLDEFQAPLYESLADQNTRIPVTVIIKDVIAYAFITGLIVFGVIATNGFLTQ